MSATYRIRLAFLAEEESDLMPTVIEACDEYTEDAWNGIPDFFLKAQEKYGDRVRTMIVEIPQDAVLSLFSSPVVQGAVGGGLD